jgi:hypothetical protein
VPKKVSNIAAAAAAALAAVNAEKGIREDDDDVMARWFGQNERSSPGRTAFPLPLSSFAVL